MSSSLRTWEVIGKMEIGPSRWFELSWDLDLPMVRSTVYPFHSSIKPLESIGHTSFANSRVNGPWASALTQELVPKLESMFRLIPDARGRFLTGHSSGGWSSLWLQIQYPDLFGGTWSSVRVCHRLLSVVTYNLHDLGSRSGGF